MSEAIHVRRGTPADAAICSRICFEAFGDINRRHGFPPEMPVPEATAGLMNMMLNNPHVYGVVAEVGGRVVGSNFLWEAEPVMGVGPITVDTSAQARSVGKRLMEDVMRRARGRPAAGGRLGGGAVNTRPVAPPTQPRLHPPRPPGG